MQRNDASGFAPSRTTTSQQTTGTTNTLKHTAMGRLLLMALLLFAFLGGTRAQETLTVYDGTDTHSEIPFWGLYADYGVRSQFIIPAGELVVMDGGTITALTFYSPDTSVEFDEGVTVYLKEVDYTTFPSDFMEDWSSMTAVYTGTIGVNSEGLMEIAFTTPYLYEGGNLMVGFQVTTWGESWPGVNWYGVNQASDSYAAVSNFADESHEWGSEIGQVNFIPKTTFIYEPDLNSCIKPHQLTVSNVTNHEATISWTSDADAWQIQMNEENLIDVTDKTYTFTSLDSETTYSVKVRTNCDGNYSNWTNPVNFTTAETCPAPSNMAITDITGHKATVSWTSGAGNWVLQYGTDVGFADGTYSEISDGFISDGATATASITGLTPETTYYVRVKALCGGEDGESRWTTKDFTTDIACPAPANLTVNDITGHTAEISWTGSADSYEMEYGIINGETYDFEDGTLQGWTNLIVKAGGGQWLHSDDNINGYDYTPDAHGGTGFAMCYSNYFYEDGIFISFATDAYLVSPQRYQMSEGASLNFWYDVENDDYPEFFDVCVATKANPTDTDDFTSIWNSRDAKGKSGEKAKVRRSNTRYGNWRQVTLDLSAYAGQSVWIAFHDVSNGKTEVRIDDITVDSGAGITWIPVEETISTTQYTLSGLTPETPYGVRVRAIYDGEDGGESKWTTKIFTTTETCPTPTNIAITDITAHSATVRWTSGAENWILQFGTDAGFAEGTYSEISDGFISDGVTATASITDLTSETTYYVRVKSICGNEDGESRWTTEDFTTTYTCPAPTNVNISEIGPHTAVVSWESDNNLFNLMLGEELITDVTSPHTLTNLTPETQYSVQVQSVCGGEDGESRWTDAKSFATLEANPVPTDVVAVPASTIATVSWTGYGESYNVKYLSATNHIVSPVFTEDFENDINGWTINGDNETNIDSTSPHSGNHSFRFGWHSPCPKYLVSCELTDVTNGMILEFYYRNYGIYHEETFSVGFSSTTSDIDAFTFGEVITASDLQWHLYSIEIPTNTKYVCWKHLSDTKYYLFIDDIAIGQGTSWTTVTTNEPSVTLTGLTPGTTYECQVQSVMAGEENSAWTPSVYFTTLEGIPMPTDVAVSTTPTTATISWTDNGNSNSYNVDYRDPEAVGNIVLSQDFEGGLNGWTKRDCGPNSVVDTNFPHSGSKAFRFSFSSGTSTPISYPQYLISPELTGVTEGTKLEFWYKNTDYNANEVFQVGTSTTGNATDDFTFGNEISAGGLQWRHYKETIPEGTKYICLKYTSNRNNLAIDDILIYQNATEWTSISTTELPVTITGLTPSTTYEYRVQNVLYGDPSDWTEVATFTTMVENPVPMDLAADNITSTTADIRWTGYGDSYNVRYRRADHVGDELFTEGFESGLNGWSRRDCGPNSNVDTHFPHSGSKAFRFSFSSGTSTPISNPQYLISPELTGVTEGAKLEFWYKNTDNNANEVFQVGTSTTGNATDNFTFGNEISAGGQQWRHYSATIPAGTKYVCLKYTSNRNNLAIDDIKIYAEAAWMTASSDEPEVTIGGMEPETAYEWQVQSVKNGAASGWSELATFTTSPLVELVNDDSGFESGAKNSAVICANATSMVDVKLAGRTLYKDGEWNTICLPFNLTLADSPLEGAIAKTLESATMTGTHVTLTFSAAVTELEAGVPYIIKWDVSEDASASDIVNPVFNGVTIVANTEDQHTISAVDGHVKFIGYYDAFGIDENDTDIYYMTAGSTLKHTGKPRTLKACRAYFQFSEAANGRLLVLNFGDGETTGIISIENGKLNNESGWYTIDGKKLDQQPTRKGLYIHNGVKVVIK